MSQYGVSKTITVKANIGAVELKKKLFDACAAEWKKVNYGHVLVFDDLDLVTTKLIDILPPEGKDDKGCMASVLYVRDPKTGRLNFVRPRGTVNTYLKMTSKDYKEYVQYVHGKEQEADFNRKIGHADGGSAHASADGVRHCIVVLSVLELTRHL